MRKQFWGVKTLMVLAFFILVFTISANAAGPGKAVLKNGESFEFVKCKSLAQFRAVELTLNEQKENRKVSFSDIQTVFDQEGKDITPQLLGDWYKPEGTESVPETESAPDSQTTVVAPDTKWVSENSSTYREMHRRLWKIAPQFLGCYSFGVGDWFRGVNPGLGFEASFMVAINDYIALKGSFSRTGLNVDDDFYYIIPPYPGNWEMSQQSSLSVYRYLVSGVYYHRLTPGQEKENFIYAYTGLGAAQHSMHAEAIAHDLDTDDYYLLDGKDTMTKFDVVLGGGVIIAISKSFSFNFDVSLDNIVVGQAETNNWSGWGNTQYAYIFDLKAGVAILF